MRREFIKTRSYGTARRRAPWALVISRAKGGDEGFWCFEAREDFLEWLNQQALTEAEA